MVTNVVQERKQNRIVSSFAEPKPTLAMYFLITAQIYNIESAVYEFFNNFFSKRWKNFLNAVIKSLVISH